MIPSRRYKQSPGYLSNKPATMGHFSLAWDDGVQQGLMQKFLSAIETNGASSFANYFLPNNPVVGNWELPGADQDKFTKEQAVTRMRDLGVDFDVPDEGMGRGEFAILAERDFQRRSREEMRARASDESFQFVKSLAGGLVGGIQDPINIGLGVIPFGGIAAKQAALAAAPGFLSRLAVRAQFGIREAAIGSTFAEAINARLIAPQNLQETDVENPVANVAMGTLIGGAFNVVGGGLLDVLGVDPNLSRTAAKQAEAAVLADQPVNVAPTVQVGEMVEGFEPGAILDGAGIPSPVPQGPKIREISLDGLLPSRRPLEKITGQVQRALGAGKKVQLDGVTVKDLAQWHDKDGTWWIFDMEDGRRITLENEMVKAPGERRAQITIETPRQQIDAALAGHRRQLETLGDDPGAARASQEHVEELARVKALPVDDQARFLEELDADSKLVAEDIAQRRGVLLADEAKRADIEEDLDFHGLSEERLTGEIAELDEEIADATFGESILKVAGPCAGRGLG